MSKQSQGKSQNPNIARRNPKHEVLAMQTAAGWQTCEGMDRVLKDTESLVASLINPPTRLMQVKALVCNIGDLELSGG